jgi:hypothetical protein
MDSLLDHKAIKTSRDILKTIVDALLANAEESGSHSIISQLLDGLFRKSITEGKLLFAELLSEKYQHLLLNHFDSFLEIEVGGLDRYGDQIYSGILKILDDMLSTNGRYTTKQRKYLEVLVKIAQENVY